MATIKTTDENFDQVVLKSDKPFVQRFTAEWCGPCKMIAPLLEELSDELKDKVLFGSHNIDDEPNTPTKFGVRGIPTILLFKGGKVVDTKVGASSKQQIKDRILSKI
jgi:thioredoxin 1